MAYALLFTANFGSENTGLSLVGRLYDGAGVQVGATITTGFREVEDGIYHYHHTTIPDGHVGTFVISHVSDADLSIGFAVNPSEAEQVSDIWEYLQTLNFSGGESVPSPERTVGTSSNPFNIQPADFRMVTPAELVKQLMDRIDERSLSEKTAMMAVQAAIHEEDARPALALRVERSFSEDSCEYIAPCGGARIVAVEVQTEGCGYTDECYVPIWWSHVNNTISLQYSMTATARITMILPNRFITDQHTVTLAIDEDNVTEIYIEGQPDIPPSGIVRICGEAWIYSYKVGVKWGSVGVTSTDSHTAGSGLGNIGSLRPSGNHTILYAHRVDSCGRLPDSQLVYSLPGAKVEFPLIIAAGTQHEHLLALASSKAYVFLMNSCRSDRDLNRFATLQTHWEKEAMRLSMRLPKLAAARPRNVRTRDDFKGTFALRAGRTPFGYGRSTRIGRLW